LRAGFGPLAGIETALKATHSEAVLVMPCDMPLLDEEIIEELLAARDSRYGVTAFKTSDGFKHPFPAIYEKSVLESLSVCLDRGGRRVLDFMDMVQPHWIALPGIPGRTLLPRMI
jgi:molybdopterin-guanine dinucleotide biosynthesis protein A